MCMSGFDTSQIDELAAAEFTKIPTCQYKLPGESETDYQERMKALGDGL